MACTLGHTVFGQTDAALDISHDHEMVHVRQFERWGPLMGPAYLGCSFVLWLTGRRPYRDNPFERRAFRKRAVNEEQSGTKVQKIHGFSGRTMASG